MAVGPFLGGKAGKSDFEEVSHTRDRWILRRTFLHSGASRATLSGVRGSGGVVRYQIGLISLGSPVAVRF